MQGPIVLVFMQMCLRDIPDQITYGPVKVYFCKMHVRDHPFKTSAYFRGVGVKNMWKFANVLNGWSLSQNNVEQIALWNTLDKLQFKKKVKNPLYKSSNFIMWFLWYAFFSGTKNLVTQGLAALHQNEFYPIVNM